MENDTSALPKVMLIICAAIFFLTAVLLGYYVYRSGYFFKPEFYISSEIPGFQVKTSDKGKAVMDILNWWNVYDRKGFRIRLLSENVSEQMKVINKVNVILVNTPQTYSKSYTKKGEEIVEVTSVNLNYQDRVVFIRLYLNVGEINTLNPDKSTHDFVYSNMIFSTIRATLGGSSKAEVQELKNKIKLNIPFTITYSN